MLITFLGKTFFSFLFFFFLFLSFGSFLSFSFFLFSFVFFKKCYIFVSVGWLGKNINPLLGKILITYQPYYCWRGVFKF